MTDNELVMAIAELEVELERLHRERSARIVRYINQ